MNQSYLDFLGVAMMPVPQSIVCYMLNAIFILKNSKKKIQKENLM